MQVKQTMSGTSQESNSQFLIPGADCHLIDKETEAQGEGWGCWVTRVGSGILGLNTRSLGSSAVLEPLHSPLVLPSASIFSSTDSHYKVFLLPLKKSMYKNKYPVFVFIMSFDS